MPGAFTYSSHLSPQHPLFSKDGETMTQRGNDLPKYILCQEVAGLGFEPNSHKNQSILITTEWLFHRGSE